MNYRLQNHKIRKSGSFPYQCLNLLCNTPTTQWFWGICLNSSGWQRNGLPLEWFVPSAGSSVKKFFLPVSQKSISC